MVLFTINTYLVGAHIPSEGVGSPAVGVGSPVVGVGTAPEGAGIALGVAEIAAVTSQGIYACGSFVYIKKEK